LFNIDKVFSFAPSQFHLVFLGVIMLLIVVFLPRGILPTVSDWLEERRSPRMAHAGARSMAEMSAAQAAEDSAAKMKGEVPS
jgi:hypothetical protein